MSNKDKIKNLSRKAQFGLYAILKDLCSEDNKTFYRVEFEGILNNYIIVKDKSKNKNKVKLIVKKVLIELKRQDILKKEPSLKGSMWVVSEKIYSNSDYYFKKLKDIPEIESLWID